MKMSDKELDQLFSNQLNDLEVEPSAELWGKFMPEIPGNKTRSGLGPMISIAATLLILLTAGLLFMPRTQKLALHGTYDPQQTINEAVAAVTQQPSATDNLPDEPAEQPTEQQPVNATVVSVKHPVSRKIETTTTDIQPLVNPADSIQKLTLVKPVNISKPERHDDIIKPISVNTIANAAPKTVPAVNPIKALAANTTPEVKAGQAVKRKKIHSLGDLLNVVIAKVDKRDNKIIQFGQNDDDEDELLNVTGVNLGPIKVKKQN